MVKMEIQAQLLTYDSSWNIKTESASMGESMVPNGKITAQCASLPPTKTYRPQRFTAEFLASSDTNRVSLALCFTLENWNQEDYLLVPAAVYDSNRFCIKKVPYAPMWRPEDYSKDCPVTTTDIPHFHHGDGESTISLRGGDSSVPGIFLYFRKENRGMAFLYPCHGNHDMENGCVIQEVCRNGKAVLNVQIMAPAVRAKGMYRFGEIRSDVPCQDRTVTVHPGESLQIQVDCYEFVCGDLAEFYQNVFEISRMFNSIVGSRSLPNEVPFSYAFHLVEEKYNRWSWYPKYQFYCVGENETLYSCWQTGWVGGINAAWPLYCQGTPETQKRALATMNFLFQKMQAPTGLFYGISDGEHIYGDDFANIQNKGFSLVRKSADALYFSACILLEMRKRGEMPLERWEQGLQRCADAFCRLFQKEGHIGQFVDVDTGEILVGNSASGGMVPAGLALCSLYFQQESYLKTAKAMAEFYYQNYTRIGLANGGPGEILSAPDSESAYALLESDVVLFECTQELRFLQWAKEAAALYSTWCMPYDYPFPPESTFGKADMRTTGAVWANVQNKHGAPGPCTHSGSALFRLARYTGEDIYMELCRDTSHNITQYLSRDDRPLWDYTHEKKAPSGFMCERVSTCDWEGFDKIGGIYASGCWCEATAMCISTDIPGIWVDRKRGKVWGIDHVECQWDKEQLQIENPTRFDLDVNVLVDNGEWETGDFDYRAQFFPVHLPAGTKKAITIGEEYASL